jgi:glutathione S-transferase
MLKLYFSPSSSSLATHIALIEADAAHELVPRLISKQETRTSEHLTLNPDGKVPVLVTDSGRVLTEVAATLLHCSQVSGRASVARRCSGGRGRGDLLDVVRSINNAWLARKRV